MDVQLRRLKAIIDQAEVDEAREELDHSCWVVVQRWDERLENLTLIQHCPQASRLSQGVQGGPQWPARRTLRARVDQAGRTPP
jgi:hypothetical protein